MQRVTTPTAGLVRTASVGPVPTMWQARVVRTLARAPIALFRTGGGWVFAGRCLMLQHTGRRSGRPRFVVLEVVARPARGRYVIAAGKGEAADWYRNVSHDPRVRLWVGRTQDAPGSARLLDRTEARARLVAYRAEHPAAWRVLRPLIARFLDRPGLTDDELFSRVPMVELVLDGAGPGST